MVVSRTKSIVGKVAKGLGVVVLAGAVCVVGKGLYTISNGIAQEGKLENRCHPSSATPQTYSIERRTIDQVFRDHDGYRLYSQTNDGLVTEDKYFVGEHPLLSFPDANQFKSLRENRRDDVVIYRDLPTGEQAFAQVLTYSLRGCTLAYDNNEMRQLYMVEVHLP